MQSAEALVTEDANTSIEHILTNELYAKKALKADDDSLQVPFPVLPGESVLFLGKTDGGVIALSDFRLFIRLKESFINIPLGLIESVECRDVFYINIYCKDAHCFRCTLPTNESCLEWYKRFSLVLHPPKKLQDVFAFAFRAWCLDPGYGQDGTTVEHGMAYKLCNEEYQEGGYSFGREVERMGFDLKTAWKICYINEDYSVCGSYPKEHLVPVCKQDKDGKELDLKSVVNFRASHRFPSVVWRNQSNGAVIARSSQPEVGWLGWRNEHDERLLQAIAAASVLSNNSQKMTVECYNGDLTTDHSEYGPKKMLIIDARSYAAAWANRAKGGGCECTEYYPNCEIQFMSLANIHTVRKSFYAVRALYGLATEQPNWLTSVENTKWLLHMSLLMRSALLVVNAVDREGRSVLVHCSDGWDRTPQIVALAELMLDPFYRTIHGFRILIEREWLAFGHKFADRCGNGLGSDDVNERCPVFLQWLDCVHQLLLQFPCAFQFNEAFLVKLVHHVYSGLFGTFLCNTIAEREEEKVLKQTSSVWSLLVRTNRKFVNLLYKPDTELVLRPSCHMRRMELWQAVYLSETAPAAADPIDMADDATELLEETGPEQTLLSKTRSCEDLPTATDHADQDPMVTKTRRLSDPHITTDPNSLLQSTDSLESSVERAVDNGGIRESLCKDLPITNGISSETLTEENGVVSEEQNTEVTAHVDEGHAAGPIDCLKPVDAGPSHHEEEDCDTSEYGIALIDSPQADNSPDITEQRANGLADHINGSTDTLTGDGTEWNPEKRTCDSVNSVLGEKFSPTSQGHSAIVAADNIKSSTSAIQNGHRLMQNGQSKELVGNKSLRNHGHNGDNHLCHNGHVVSETNPPFRLEDVLSKLDIESLLDGAPSLRDGFDVKRLARCVSRESSSGREETGDHGSSSSYHCRTSNCSTGPPTPGTDLKSNPWLSRHQSSLGKHLDCDGLTTFVDPVQSRLAQIEADYEHKLHELKHQLYLAKAVIYQCTMERNGTGKQMDVMDDVLSTESADSGEQGSLEGGSTATSDVSWEQVEERDAPMTLWVPDHAVTHCAGCDEMFWVVRRKHHCRNCGRVFCGECTKYYKPLPDQYLPNPQRVCMDCYDLVSEGRATIITNGMLMETSKQNGAMASS